MKSALSDDTLAYVRTLTFRADAQRKVSILPFSSVYWEDEMPGLARLVQLPERDRKQIMQVFAIRQKIWNGLILSEDDQHVWDDTRQQLPDWALFRRLVLSAEDDRERREIEESCAKGLEEFFGRADRVVITDEGHGLQSFSATFLLKQPWWRRLLRALRLDRFKRKF